MRQVIAAGTVVLLVALIAPGVSALSQISIDHVDGLASPGQIYADQPITFHMRLMFDEGSDRITSFINGFRVYSPDGAIWQPISWDTANIDWSSMFDLISFIVTPYSVTGSGADTIMFAGVAMMRGLQSPFDEIVWSISTQLSSSQQGKHLCVDSCFGPPSGEWTWALSGGGRFPPDWPGPYCFEVVPAYICGDIDGSGKVDTLDLMNIAWWWLTDCDGP